MTESILLALDKSQTLQLMSRAIRAVGYKVIVAHDSAGIKKLLQESHPSIVLLGEKLQEEKGLEIIEELLIHYPTLPIIFLATENSPGLIQEVLRAGISAYLEPPLKTDEIVNAVESSLQRAKRMGDWLRREVDRSTASLEKRVSEMEVLLTIGRDITGTLDLDGVLNNVVAAAVKLTKSEEGSLLLLDEESNELFMRAGYNFEDEFAKSFRLPVSDSLAGQVMKTGEPINLNKDALVKIKTAYLVQSLVYVPIKLNEQTIGVLGIDNRQHHLPFSERDILLLSLLSDYAAVAIENARLYQVSEDERSKFEAVLSNMDDALIILDQQDRIELINEMMCNALGVKGEEVSNQIISDVISQRDILNILQHREEISVQFFEVVLDDDRVFNAQYTPISDVGAAITMQ
ncbi:MAG: GAF domain-containing protein, partial [Anaerolineae bacterium]|nr:GAF domain-containing protein [Anaerolineae bacterium]